MNFKRRLGSFYYYRALNRISLLFRRSPEKAACDAAYKAVLKLEPEQIQEKTAPFFHKCDCLLVAAHIECKKCGFTGDTSFSIAIKHMPHGLHCTCSDHQSFNDNP